MPQGFAGVAESQGFHYKEQDPLHVYLHHLASDGTLRIGPKETDCMVYVWKGAVEAGGSKLASGSSMIVERGATLEIRGSDAKSEVLTFSAARPGREARAGGHVHLLPTERVPRLASLAGSGGVGGAMHADASCPTCQVWLHENSLAPLKLEMTEEDLERGVHSHSEDEVIFVIDGQMRLGGRLYGPGTAIAIAADTLYSFGIGPEGLKFINFRAGLPTEIKFKDGRTMDEVGFWRNQIAAPEYLTPQSAA
jgi:hypothetical protein